MAQPSGSVRGMPPIPPSRPGAGLPPRPGPPSSSNSIRSSPATPVVAQNIASTIANASPVCNDYQPGDGWRKKNVCQRCNHPQSAHANPDQQIQSGGPRKNVPLPAGGAPPPSRSLTSPVLGSSGSSHLVKQNSFSSMAKEVAAAATTTSTTAPSLTSSASATALLPGGGGGPPSSSPRSAPNPTMSKRSNSLTVEATARSISNNTNGGTSSGGGGGGGSSAASILAGLGGSLRTGIVGAFSTGDISSLRSGGTAGAAASALAMNGAGGGGSVYVRQPSYPPVKKQPSVIGAGGGIAPGQGARKPGGKPEYSSAWITLQPASEPYALGVSTYYRVLHNLLQVMDLKEDTIVEVEGLTANGRAALDESRRYAPITPETRTRLQKIVTDLTEFLELQHKLNLVIKTQALVRGALARKKFKEMKQTHIHSSLRGRNDCFREIHKREKIYVENLRTIVKDYMEPLKENAKGIRALCTAQEVAAIFGNSETLLTVHSELMNQLNNIQAKWPEVDGIGEVFLTMAPFFKAYGDYVNNFQKAIDTLLQCQQKERFSSFLNEIFEKGQARGMYVDLHGLLSTPLNHISGYEGLVQILLDNTPPEHRDYKSLTHCYSIISGTCKYIRDSLALADNIRTIQAVQDKLYKEKGDPKGVILTGDLNRRFTKEGPCFLLSEIVKKPAKEKAYLFVFNDLVLITTPYKSLYKVLDRLDVDQCTLEPVTDPSPDVSLFAMTLSAGGGRRYHLGFASQKERQEWFTLTKRLISYYQTNKVFGTPLPRLCDSQPVPHIVQRLASHLDSAKAYELEGIFRVSGNAAQVTFIRDSFDRAGIGCEPDINLAMSSPHEVAGAFKMFFREMPEPLFTFDLYEPLLRAITQYSVDNNVDNYIQESGRLLKTLPRVHKDLLFFLLNFLTKYIAYSAKSKMTATNLAIVFAPNICRPRQETIDYSLQLGKVNMAVELLITHSARVQAIVNGDQSTST